MRLATDHGYDVIEAADGLEGLSVLERVKPGLVFLDIEMPNLTGWELLSKLKDREGLGEIPIVILTGRVDQCTRDRAEQFGIVEILSKRHIFDDVVDTLNRVLGTRRPGV